MRFPKAEPALYLHVGRNLTRDAEWWQSQTALLAPDHPWNVSARHGGYAGWYVTGHDGQVLVQVDVP